MASERIILIFVLVMMVVLFGFAFVARWVFLAALVFVIIGGIMLIGDRK
jgi:hypothetical protein